MSNEDFRTRGADDEERLDEMLRKAFASSYFTIPAESLADGLARRGKRWTRILLNSPDEDCLTTRSPERGEPDIGNELAGRYDVFGEIARGGVGIILRGRDRVLGRDIAIKILRCEHRTNDEIQERFFDEAQIGAQLQHPGIVPVHEVGLIDGEHAFFTMKLVRGRTLSETLRSRSTPSDAQRQHIDIFRKTCQTMAYAHERGVVHRDLKPSNVMVGRFGEVQVMDWGLAKLIRRGGVSDEIRYKRDRDEEASLPVSTLRSGEPDSHSRVGSVFGTPAYMAPEQARGNSSLIDERTDVFALGAILCEILTGAPPYDRSRQALDDARACRTESAFERLESCGADPALVRIARQCMHMEPSGRPENAGAVEELLRLHECELEARTERAKVEAAEQRTLATTARRTQRLTIALSAAIVLAMVSAAAGWIVWNKVEAARQRASTARIQQSMQDAIRLASRASASEAQDADPLFASALAALDREALTQVGSAASVQAQMLRSQITNERSQAAAAAARDSMHRELLTGFQNLLTPRVEAAIPGAFEHGSQLALDKARSALCSRFGIDVDNSSPEVVATAFRGPQASTFSSAFDYWAWVRRRHVKSSGDQLASVAHLISIARILAPVDDMREQLRTRLLQPDLWHDIEALLATAKAFDPAKESIESTLLLALILRSISPEHTITFLERCSPHFADQELVFWILGDAYQTTNQLDRARACFLVLQSLAPNHAGYAFRLTRIHQEQRDIAAMLAWAKRGLKLAPEIAGAYTNVACAYLEAKDHVAARPYLERALELRPDSLFALSNLASVIKREGTDPQGDQCAALLERAVAAHPGVWLAHRSLGSHRYWQRRLDDAALHYREALRLNPNDLDLHSRLSRILTYRGSWVDAEASCREWLRRAPEDPSAHDDLGVALEAQDKLDAARLSFERALQLDANHASAISHLGELTLQQGDFQKAVALFERENELRPGWALPCDHLGIIAALGGRRDHARSLIETADRRAPARRLFRAPLAGLLLRLSASYQGDVGNIDAETRDWLRTTARTWLEDLRDELDAECSRGGLRGARRALIQLDIISNSPRFSGFRDPSTLADFELGESNAWADLWSSLRGLRDRVHEILSTSSSASTPSIESDISSLRATVDANPNDVAARLFLVQSLTEAKRHEEAVRAAEEAVRAFHDHAAIHDVHARALFSAGRVEASIASARLSVSLGGPNLARHTWNLAMALIQLNRHSEALVPLRRVASLMPGDVDAHIQLGLTISETGQHEEAVTHLSTLVSNNPKSAACQHALAVALRRGGQLDQALECARRAVGAVPTSAIYHREVGLIYSCLRRYDEAITAMSLALQIQPHDTETRYVTAQTYLRADNPILAVQHLRMAMEGSDSRRSQILALLSRILSMTPLDDLRDPAEAMRNAQEAARLSPNDASTIHALAAAHYANSQYEQACSILRERLKSSREDPIGTLLYSLCLSKSGESAQATRILSTISEHLDNLHEDYCWRQLSKDAKLIINGRH